MFCRRNRSYRRAARTASVCGATVGLLLASAAGSLATAPDSAVAASPVRITLLGLPLTTAAWAIIGLVALLGGLLVASRSARTTSRAAHSTGPTLVESLQASARSGQLRLAEQRSDAQAAI